MCGRFTLHTPLAKILPRFKITDIPFDYVPSYNIAPTQSVFAIIPTADGNRPALMRWGLIPSWRKNPQAAPTIINARAETLEEKVTFRQLVNPRRCLIIADGFYEWKQENSGKIPVYITVDGGQPFAFAGLWDLWRRPGKEVVSSCLIITSQASGALQSVHHRMPVILSLAEEEIWLSPKSFPEIKQLLAPAKRNNLSFSKVSPLVNSPLNNSPRCIDPLD